MGNYESLFRTSKVKVVQDPVVSDLNFVSEWQTFVLRSKSLVIFDYSYSARTHVRYFKDDFVSYLNIHYNGVFKKQNIF